MNPREWTDPRDGSRWLIVRREFRHDSYGYTPACVVLFASPRVVHSVTVPSRAGAPLDDDELCALLDRARSKVWIPDPSRGTGSGGTGTVP